MIAEKYEDLRSSAQERMSGMGDYINRGTEQVANIVEDRPAGALLLSCLAGFAVGLLISRGFAPERSFSSSLDASAAERFGRNLLDKIEHVMPAMVRERLSR